MFLLYYTSLQLGPLAQLVEHLTFNQVVVGSNPTRPTILFLNDSFLNSSLLNYLDIP